MIGFVQMQKGKTMTKAEAIAEISKQIPDCEKCPCIVSNCKKLGHYDDCMKQKEALFVAIGTMNAVDNPPKKLTPPLEEK